MSLKSFVLLLPSVLLLCACSPQSHAGQPELTAETKSRYMRFVNRVDQFHKAGEKASGQSTSMEAPGTPEDGPTENTAEEIAKIIRAASCQMEMTLPKTPGNPNKTGAQEFIIGFQIFGEGCPVKMTLGAVVGQQMTDENNGRLYMNVVQNMYAIDEAVQDKSTFKFIDFKYAFDVKVQKQGEGADMNGHFSGGGEAYSLEEGHVKNILDGHIRAKQSENGAAFADIEEKNTTVFADGTSVTLTKILKADQSGQEGYCLLNNERITEDECVEIIEKLRLPELDEQESFL